MTEQFNNEENFLDDIMKLLPQASQLPTPFRQNVAIAPAKFKFPSFVATAIPTSVLATRLRFAYPFDQDEMACLHLDGEYTVFGETVAGIDVIDRIASVPVDMYDRPLRDVRILSVKRDPKSESSDAE